MLKYFKLYINNNNNKTYYFNWMVCTLQSEIRENIRKKQQMAQADLASIAHEQIQTNKSKEK